MSRPAVIVDTNVVVAGLLTKQDASPVARILDGMLGAAFPFVLSEALLAEYRAVLVRPVLRKLHGLPVAEVEAILTDLAQHAIIQRRALVATCPTGGLRTLLPLGAYRKVRNPYLTNWADMLAKITSKNQLTLPKSITQAVGPVEYFDVEARDGQIILTPVRIQRGDAVRAKLAELDLTEADIAQAVAWARGAGPAKARRKA